MFDYIKKVIEDSSTGSPSSKRWVLVVSTSSLCIGFLITTIAMVAGVSVPETIVLGLATIIAGLSGSSYIATKNKEVILKKEREDEDNG